MAVEHVSRLTRLTEEKKEKKKIIFLARESITKTKAPQNKAARAKRENWKP